MISVVKMMPTNGEGKVKALLNVTIGVVTVYGVKVVEGPNGLFVAMPQRKDQNGKYWDVVRIENTNDYQRASLEILDYYNARAGASVSASDVDW